MAELYLICEGEHSSLDVRVLDLVVGQIMGLPARIEPAGGGSQPRIVRQWLETRSRGIEMKGKHLRHALGEWLRRRAGPRLTNEQLETELLDALGEVYRTASPFAPDDFAELAGKIRNQLSAPATP